MEPHIAPLHERVETFQKLSDKIGSKCVIWRDCRKLIWIHQQGGYKFCGIKHNSCIDQELIESIIGYPIKVRADGQREACGCVKCEDIGNYNTCLHGCKYCYANYRDEQVKEQYSRYDVNSPLLCDSINEFVDKVTDRPVKSLRDTKKMAGQMSLF